MSKLFKKTMLIPILAIAGLSLFMSCSKAPQPQQAEDNSENVPTTRGSTPTQTVKETEAYWTEERMRKAKPLPMGRPESEAPADADDDRATDLQKGLPPDAQQGDANGGPPGGER